MTTCRLNFSLCILLLSSLPITLGCGSSYSLPPVDVAAAVDAAFAKLDKNGDGQLDKEELAGSPPLLAEINEYDLSGDEMINKEEMLDRITFMYDRKIAFSPADCTLTLDGEPLAGATVKFIPEDYLGEGTTLPAEGITDDSGVAQMTISQDALPPDLADRALMQVGLFRAEVTHPSKNIPAKYNTETTLGFELHPDAHYGPHAKFDLVSK